MRTTYKSMKKIKENYYVTKILRNKYNKSCEQIKSYKNVTLLYDNSHQNNLRYASAIYAPLGLPTLNGIDDEKRHAIVV